jgi:AICAR transformylase/IMP cyclohydrolase PurH
MQTEKEKKKALFKKLSGATLSAINIGDYDKAWDNLQEFLKEIEKAAKFIEK